MLSFSARRLDGNRADKAAFHFLRKIVCCLSRALVIALIRAQAAY